ncbi:MAG: L,D-transpeptidase family protein [Myxococcales bacterium]|nr:L,D-transpeptidase family protein [Myxococcales bacterium]
MATRARGRARARARRLRERVARDGRSEPAERRRGGRERRRRRGRRSPRGDGSGRGRRRRRERGRRPACICRSGRGRRADAATPAAPTPVRAWTLGRQDDARSGPQREAAAFAAKEAEVKGLFAAAGVDFPPRQVLFRVFKEEMELEVWASDEARGPLKAITTFSICAASGDPGPKTRQGDGQVPEGFYAVDFLKPRSDYYLALHVNYPNARDRAIRSTGSSIMIHGRCASIGCLAMSDERIQELWVIARGLTKGKIEVHIFPQRDLDGLIAKTSNAGLKAFWENLAEGKRLFEADHRLPKIGHDGAGAYTFEAR